MPTLVFTSFPALLRLVLGFSFLWLGGCEKQEPDPAPASHIIVDGRNLETAAPESSWLNHPAVLQASIQARTYWQAQNPSYEEDFRVMDSTNGSYTGSGKQQTAVLYLMSLWPRCCSNMGLALIEDNRLVMNTVFEGGRQQLHSAGDLNNDALDELVLIGSFGMGGSNETGMEILSFGDLSFGDSHLTTIANHTLVSDDCATLHDDSQIRAWLVTRHAGQSSPIQAELFTSSCENDSWNSTGTIDTLVMTEPLSADSTFGFIVLPVQ
jgi:hypothetical protein